MNSTRTNGSPHRDRKQLGPVPRHVQDGAPLPYLQMIFRERMLTRVALALFCHLSQRAHFTPCWVRTGT